MQVYLCGFLNRFKNFEFKALYIENLIIIIISFIVDFITGNRMKQYLFSRFKIVNRFCLLCSVSVHDTPCNRNYKMKMTQT